MASSSPLTKELWTELTKIKLFTRDQNLSNGKFFYEDSFFYAAGEGLPNRNVIIGRLWPTSDIYKDYALQIEIHLPSTYPGDPPEVKLDKVIYHPNVDDKGRLSADGLSKAGSWIPKTTLTKILEIIIDVIDNPSTDKPMNDDAAKDYDKNRAEYTRKATETIRKTGLLRS